MDSYLGRGRLGLRELHKRRQFLSELWVTRSGPVRRECLGEIGRRQAEKADWTEIAEALKCWEFHLRNTDVVRECKMDWSGKE